MHGTESQGHNIAPRSRGVAKLSSAKAWNSNAEDSHGEVAQGRSGYGMERSCFAEAKRSGTQCAGAWLVLFINQGRKERNHEKV